MVALLLFLQGATVCKASPAVDEILDGIVSCEEANSGTTSIAQWIASMTPDGVGNSEWFALALSRYSGHDGPESIKNALLSYAERLEAFAENNDVKSATTRQRMALTLIACGRGDSPFVRSTANDSIGSQGVMSLIFGLHLMNNGIESDVTTKDALIDSLLSMRLSDGGWAVMGSNSDVDVTAMALQALAPNTDKTSVSEAVDEAVSLLSAKQLENGGFNGFGAENAESASQVVGALSSLGIDMLSDTRFIKNGNTILDALLSFRLEDGSFSHERNGKYNYTATQQVFYSLTAYTLMLKGERLFVFPVPGPSEARPTPAESAPASEVTAVPAPTGTPSSPSPTPGYTESPAGAGSSASARTGFFGKMGYKPVVLCFIGAACIAACILLIVFKKRNPKNFIFVVIVGAVLSTITIFTDISSVKDYYNGEATVKENITGHVTLTINCEKVAGLSTSSFIPEDCIILPPTGFDISAGDTVFDILTEAARVYNIHIDSKGARGMIYVSGISYLYEYDHGDLSGWVYHVNGVSPSVGCGDYVLSDGDKIEWLYTLDLGRDLE